MKNTKTALIVLGVIIATLGTVAVANYVAKQFISDTVVDCKNITGNNLTATFGNNSVVPNKVSAKQCDTLTIYNVGDSRRLVSFGVHDRHIAYDGIKQKLLKQNQNFTITLDKSGTFVFHDHYDEDVGATFIVKKL